MSTRPNGAQGPRKPEAFPLARIWASLEDWEKDAITNAFKMKGGVDYIRTWLDIQAAEWTGKLVEDANNRKRE